MNPRTCIGCRQRDSADELLRIVADSDEHQLLIADPRRTAPGRGVHLHPRQSCYEAAVRRRAFSRALRRGGAWDLSGVEEFLRAAGVLAPGSSPTDNR